MTSYSLAHLADRTLLRGLADSVSQDRTTTAMMLAQIAEVDDRRLYVPAGYSSMYLYCVHEHHMSEDVAYKRICAARAARRFPAIFPALANGRLHLSAVVMLAPHLSPETADEVLAAATHRTKAQIELLLAERFPRPDMPTFVQAIALAAAADEPAAGRIEAPAFQLAPGRVVPSAGPDVNVRMEPLPARAKPVPLSAGKYAVQFTMDAEMHAELLQVQTLLGHVLPSADVAEVFRRALHELHEKLEKQKFGKCVNPRPQRGPAKGRHIPAAVKRAVWERDGGRCTFVSEQGRRCEKRADSQYDHVEPVARGGETTTDNLRLLCRAHNFHEAERVYGPALMAGKREQARERAAQAKADAQPRAIAEANAIAEAKARAAAEAASQQEVVPWIRAHGCNAAEARRAAGRCAGMVGASLEARVRVAVQGLGPPGARRVAPVAGGPA